VFVDADPSGKGDDFADPEARALSLQKATHHIAELVKFGVKEIAVETCAPRASDVVELIAPARKSGYAVEMLSPAGDEPNDLLYCFQKSSHDPDPSFLSDLAAEWQSVDFDEPAVANSIVDQARRKNAWAIFTAAMAAASEERSSVLIAELEANYPEEARALMIDTGPTWGRLDVQRRPPAYPLAPISEYWAEVQWDRIGTVSQTTARMPLADPQPSLAVEPLNG
jgi:hypothetical protein